MAAVRLESFAQPEARRDRRAPVRRRRLAWFPLFWPGRTRSAGPRGSRDAARRSVRPGSGRGVGGSRPAPRRDGLAGLVLAIANINVWPRKPDPVLPAMAR